MPDFTQPPQGGQIKIPKTVALADTDPERQKEYAELEKLRLDELGGKEAAPATVPDKVLSPAPLEPDVDDLYYQPTEDDKKAFVRALLGAKSFEKRYKLFGTLEVGLADRSTQQTEEMFSALQRDSSAGLIKADTDQEWQVWLERYSLAVNLTEHKTDVGVKRYSPPASDKINERVKELMQLPKPLYAAFMQANRCFETVVDVLTRRAQDENFWKTGGADSRSNRTSAAR